MSGIGFTVGLLCGLLIHLPAESLPASSVNEHHLGRVRRMAQLRTTDEGSDYPLDDLSMLRSGEANKQTGQSALLDNSGIRNKGISGEISAGFAGLNAYPNDHSNSVVYVNPRAQKLVLDKRVNNESDTNSTRQLPARDGAYFDVVRDNNIASIPTQVDKSAALAKGSDRPISGATVDVNDVTRGIFWSRNVEDTCHGGFTSDDHVTWKEKESRQKIVQMEEGCGRMQNRVLVFQSSNKACARYRLNIDQIQGEIYSYYLSKLFGIPNVPPSTLHLADTKLDQWRMIGQDIANAKWSEEKPVILSKWIPGLEPAYIPKEFRNLSNVLAPKDLMGTAKWDNNRLVSGKTGSSLCELLQWSDLIVFDYITANLDRVVNNLFNLQWNEKMMTKPAHNLEKGSAGNLVFLDNESGLFHGYRLLDKYSGYHEKLLNSLCVFRERTVRAITNFIENDNIGEALQSIFEENEPLYRYVPKVPLKNIKVLKQRMRDVLSQVQKCESNHR